MQRTLGESRVRQRLPAGHLPRRLRPLFPRGVKEKRGLPAGTEVARGDRSRRERALGRLDRRSTGWNIWRRRGPLSRGAGARRTYGIAISHKNGLRRMACRRTVPRGHLGLVLRSHGPAFLLGRFRHLRRLTRLRRGDRLLRTGRFRTCMRTSHNYGLSQCKYCVGGEYRPECLLRVGLRCPRMLARS